MTQQDEQVNAIIQQVLDWEERLTEEQQTDLTDILDELVHDMKSQEASDTNNGGTQSQLLYIIEAYEHTPRGMDQLRSDLLLSDGRLPPPIVLPQLVDPPQDVQPLAFDIWMLGNSAPIAVACDLTSALSIAIGLQGGAVYPVANFTPHGYTSPSFTRTNNLQNIRTELGAWGRTNNISGAPDEGPWYA